MSFGQQITGFFERQDFARRNSWILIVCIPLSIILIIVGFYLVTNVAHYYISNFIRNYVHHDYSYTPPIVWFRPGIFFLVMIATLSFMGVISLAKLFQLLSGGKAIMAKLGGVRIGNKRNDRAERRLLNVVDEMAVASLTPKPKIYVLDAELTINAFSIGYRPSSAALGVTRGALLYLSREELQGLVAHEFSHIANGDMRWNTFLVGILSGIEGVSEIGGALFESDRDFTDAEGAGAARLYGYLFMVVGFVPFAFGYVGLMAARLVKAAVSRQREVLADASAVQYTRNPDGLIGALKKIGGLRRNWLMQAPGAVSFSHMFFSSVFETSIMNPFATHPPLANRILPYDPDFDGDFPEVTPYREPVKPSLDREFETAQDHGPGSYASLETLSKETTPIESIKIPGVDDHSESRSQRYLHNVTKTMPAPLISAMNSPFGGQALVYAMLLRTDVKERQQQLQIVYQCVGKKMETETLRIENQVRQQGELARLPILEHLRSTLSGLSPEQYEPFHDTFVKLVKIGETITFFEFTVQRILFDHLDIQIEGKSPPEPRYLSLTAIIDDLVQLISCLAHAGDRYGADSTKVFGTAFAGMAELGDIQVELLPKKACSLQCVATSLKRLAQSSPSLKEKVMRAVVQCISANRQITVAEAQLLHATASSLQFPMPRIAIRS